MVSCIFSILFLITALRGLQASTCTDLCDLEGAVSPKTYICATDYNTYHAPLSAIVGLPPPWACYRRCGLDVLYPGVCGCPNDCGSATGRGACVNGTCVCGSGWGGPDCNSIACPHSCSGNGKCQSISKKLDVCECKEGFTGVDCAIPTLSLPVLPYGEILPNYSTPYYKKDKYGDDHPLFNMSVIGNWHIEMDPEDFDMLLKPVNTWNQTHQDVKAYFTNGNIKEKIHKASIKLKGHFARMAIKKSFTLRFKEKFFHMDNLVLKASSLDGTYLKNQVTVEYLRSMMVPSARASFTTVTINGIFWGLYWMKEEIDAAFLHSRIGNDKGNFYAMSAYLNYQGDNPEVYQNCSNNNVGPFTCYKEKFGNGNWTDLIGFAKYLNQTSPQEFQGSIEQTLDVDNFLRAMVVTSAIDDPDSFTRNGNNWALYSDPKANMWHYIAKDFEDSMFNPLNRANSSVTMNEKAVLAYRIMQIPSYEERFNLYFTEFLKNCFSPKLDNAAVKRISAYEAFLEPVIATDAFFHITFGLPVTDGLWKLAVEELQLFIELRYMSLNKQF